MNKSNRNEVSGPKVLLVEDDTMLREVLAYQLTELGFRVVEAKDGTSAKDLLLNQFDFRLIISDLNMPDMTGLDLAEWIQNHAHEIESTPSFILMTGQADQFNSQKAKALNIIHFLPKPFEQDFLLSLIQNSLYGESESAA